MLATLRFSLAALLLLPFALARWRRSPASARELGGAALLGVTMLVASQALAICLTLNARVSPTLANTFNYAAPVIALGHTI